MRSRGCRSDVSECGNSQCRTSQTPLWRRGWTSSDGRPVMLCNACGLHFKKGHYCRLCKQIFPYKETLQRSDHGNEDTTEWQTCQRCSKFVHLPCETKEKDHQVINGAFFCSDCLDVKGSLVTDAFLLSQQEAGYQHQKINRDHNVNIRSSIKRRTSDSSSSLSVSESSAPYADKKVRHSPKVSNGTSSMKYYGRLIDPLAFRSSLNLLLPMPVQKVPLYANCPPETKAHHQERQQISRRITLNNEIEGFISSSSYSNEKYMDPVAASTTTTTTTSAVAVIDTNHNHLICPPQKRIPKSETEDSKIINIVHLQQGMNLAEEFFVNGKKRKKILTPLYELCDCAEIEYRKTEELSLTNNNTTIDESFSSSTASSNTKILVNEDDPNVVIGDKENLPDITTINAGAVMMMTATVENVNMTNVAVVKDNVEDLC